MERLILLLGQTEPAAPASRVEAVLQCLLVLQELRPAPIMHGTNLAFVGEGELEWQHSSAILLQKRNMPSARAHHEVHQHTVVSRSEVVHSPSIGEYKTNIAIRRL